MAKKFNAIVPLFISHKYFLLLTRPRGPIFGAKDDVAPTSPPTHLRYTENK
jgi:hypothetical protein